MVAELPYTLHTRYASIAIAWTIILIPPTFLNIALFYGLWYGRPEMDRVTVLTTPTAVLGVFTVLSILERVWKLVQPSPKFRLLNVQTRFALDVFQWGYFAALILISTVIMTTLARGDRDHDRNHELQIRLISLPSQLLMALLATLTLISLLLDASGIRLPFQFGSVAPGNPLRPAVYYIVEDVVAVDGFGGVEYRAAFNARYEGSEVFRAMIWTVSVVWMVAFYVLAAAFACLVVLLPWQAVYAVGWAGPFPVAGLLAVWTTYFVKGRLREE